ncbi:MAG: ABC transporter ATP-binding protein [Sphaerochaetaceae bacterium]|nr:ABC transporter ATP-binding protein [Sphaerochaetaceae bacterium]
MNNKEEQRDPKFIGRGGHGNIGKTVQKPKNIKKSTKRLLTWFSPYKGLIMLVILCSLSAAVFTIIGPKILGRATTEIFEGITSSLKGGDGIDFGSIKSILLILVVLYFISSAFTFISGFVMSTITQKISRKMRKDLLDVIHGMPFSRFDATTHGDILSRVTNDVDLLSQSLNQSSIQILTSVTTMAGVLVMMLSISVVMTLITLVVLPLSMIIISRIVKKSQTYFAAQQKSLGALNGQIEEVYSGQLTVKAFNGEEEQLESFIKTNEQLYDSAWKSQFLSGLMMPIMHAIGDIAYVAIALIGGMLAIRQTITVGDIQAFIQYMKSFTQPISQIAQISNLFQSTIAAAERIFEFLDEQQEEDISSVCTINRLEGSVDFSHVSFGYDKKNQVIHDFTAHIRPGQKVAIVGPTGSGKTTMVKLLMRFYDVDSGEIRIDSHNIAELGRNDLRSHFGMVLQDAWLFAGSIRENIRYGNLQASDEMVERAAENAHIDHFIHTLPGGYDMEINEDSSNISQGQRQLITIARAMISDPEILILDEATSSVDTRTEELIQRAMDTVMKGRTSFIIAHRLSTIQNADIILVMKDGDIVEMGDHQSLLKQKGMYHQLYQAQFERTGA